MIERQFAANPSLLALTRATQVRATAVDYKSMVFNQLADPDFDAWFAQREAALKALGSGLVPHSRERMEEELRLAFDAGRQTCVIRELDTQEAHARE